MEKSNDRQEKQKFTRSPGHMGDLLEKRAPFREFKPLTTARHYRDEEGKRYVIMPDSRHVYNKHMMKEYRERGIEFEYTDKINMQALEERQQENPKFGWQITGNTATGEKCLATTLDKDTWQWRDDINTGHFTDAAFGQMALIMTEKDREVVDYKMYQNVEELDDYVREKFKASPEETLTKAPEKKNKPRKGMEQDFNME